MENFGLPGQEKIFINSSLRPYYKILCSKSKKLFTLRKINTVYFSNGTIRINNSSVNNSWWWSWKTFSWYRPLSIQIRLNKYKFLCSYCCCVLLSFIVFLFFHEFFVSLTTTISNFFFVILFVCLFNI